MTLRRYHSKEKDWYLFSDTIWEEIMSENTKHRLIENQTI